MTLKNLLSVPLILISISGANASAQYYSATVSACFTPYQNCTARIVQHIRNAKKTIYVQAYSFTSWPIAHALVNANKRGIKVRVILDKSDLNCQQFSFAHYLLNHHIPLWDDFSPNIAHNKVMIFDNATVETGSFNFTKSAQYYNTENVLFINNNKLAKLYINNWYRRQQVAKIIKKYPCN